MGLFNLLRYAGEPGLLEHKPLTAKAVSVAAAMAITYLGNRYWTWRHRSGRGHGRDFVLFVIFSLIGMAFSLVCLAVSHYMLGLTSPLADNISANVIGMVLGTTFRFWAYRTHVFPHPRETSTAPRERTSAGSSAELGR